MDRFDSAWILTAIIQWILWEGLFSFSILLIIQLINIYYSGFRLDTESLRGPPYILSCSIFYLYIRKTCHGHCKLGTSLIKYVMVVDSLFISWRIVFVLSDTTLLARCMVVLRFSSVLPPTVSYYALQRSTVFSDQNQFVLDFGGLNVSYSECFLTSLLDIRILSHYSDRHT